MPSCSSRSQGSLQRPALKFIFSLQSLFHYLLQKPFHPPPIQFPINYFVFSKHIIFLGGSLCFSLYSTIKNHWGSSIWNHLSLCPVTHLQHYLIGIPWQYCSRCSWLSLFEPLPLRIWQSSFQSTFSIQSTHLRIQFLDFERIHWVLSSRKKFSNLQIKCSLVVFHSLRTFSSEHTYPTSFTRFPSMLSF